MVGVAARADETPVLVGLLAPLCFALFHFRMRPCAPSRFRLGLGTITQKRSVIYCPHAFNPRRLRCAIFTGLPLGRHPAGHLAPARCLVPAGAKRNAIERDGAEDRFLRHRFRLADNAHSRVDNAYGEILPAAPAARPHDGSGNGGRLPAGRTQGRSLVDPIGLRDRPLRSSDRRLPLKLAVCVQATARLAPDLRRDAAAIEYSLFVLKTERPCGPCRPVGGRAERATGHRPSGGPAKKWRSANASLWQQLDGRDDHGNGRK